MVQFETEEAHCPSVRAVGVFYFKVTTFQTALFAPFFFATIFNTVESRHVRSYRAIIGSNSGS